MNSGGNNNITNNIILNGVKKLLDVSAFQIYGETIERNIIVSNNNNAMLIGSEGTFSSKKIQYCDNNLYWNKDMDILNTNKTLFPLGNGGLNAWKDASKHDLNSIVEDPLFVDPLNGNFKLKDDSPAITKLGFQLIPDINAPYFNEVGA